MFIIFITKGGEYISSGRNIEDKALYGISRLNMDALRISRFIKTTGKADRISDGIFRHTIQYGGVPAKCFDAVYEGFSTVSDVRCNLTDPAIDLCDYVGLGNFPHFFKKEDADAAIELLNTDSVVQINADGEIWID